MDKVDICIEKGIAFLKGDAAAKDYEQAFYWLDKARDLGSKKAESIIRDMRKRSLGVPFSDDVPETVGGTNTNEPPGTDQQTERPAGGFVGIEGDEADDRLANPNRCIACGMEALSPSTSIIGARHCAAELGGCGATSMIPIIENGLDRGLALQPYRESSHSRDRSVYSSLGALIHMAKYDNRVDDSMRADIISEIANRIDECAVIEQLIGCDKRNLTVVPAPSSKRRKLQPVTLLAQLISEYGYEYDSALTKKSRIESKSRPRGTELALDDVKCSGDVNGKAVLLVDDTYGEGATLRACIRALKKAGAEEVYFLSICKNTFGGMKGSATDDDDIY